MSTTASKFIAGLRLIEDAIVGASFYNSSGGDAGFDLNRELTEDELRQLKELGFWDYMYDGGVASIAFPEWSKS